MGNCPRCGNKLTEDPAGKDKKTKICFSCSTCVDEDGSYMYSKIVLDKAMIIKVLSSGEEEIAVEVCR